MESPEYDEAYDIDKPKMVRISLHLIQKRHLPVQCSNWSQQQIVDGLNQITHLRLDRENICSIDNLELLSQNVTNIYLQKNQISQIENLDCLSDLRFLTLADNRISRISGLTHLTKLAFLDLSGNNIKSFDIDELPQSLVILNLQGNPCTGMPDYRGRILQDLAKLGQLDGQKVTKEERRESGFVVSSEDDEDEDEDEEDEENIDNINPRQSLEEFHRTGETGDVVFQQTSNDILERSQARLESTLVRHRENLAILDGIRVEHSLPPSSRKEKSHHEGFTPRSVKSKKGQKT